MISGVIEKCKESGVIMGIAIGSINETELLNSFEDGIKREELFFHYQPKMNLKTLRVDSAEVLIRWMHPYYWFLTPNKFIPLLEREGLIKELDIYVVRMVCDKLKEIRKSKPDFRLSFNISRQGFSDKKTIEEIVRIIEESSLPKESLEIELTESGVIGEKEERFLIDEVKYIRNKGIGLAIDDFGCGFSSLALLKDLDISVLKLDRSFIGDNSNRTLTIVKSIVDLAKSLNIKIVAEGIETEEMYNFVKEIGCDYAQVYYLSKPMEYKDFCENFINN